MNLNRVITVIFILFSLNSFSFGEYRWSNVIIGGGGYVTGIITCPTRQNLIFAKTDVGGAYRWNEEEQRWMPLTDWISRNEIGYLGIESIAIDPQSPNRIYMAAGLEYFSQTKPAIFYSEDYGETFQKTVVTFTIHGNGYGRGTGERLLVDPNDSNTLYYASRKHGLWKSADMARSWQKLSSFPVLTTPDENGISVISIDPASSTPGNASQTIFAGISKLGAQNLYVSYDAGLTWNPIEGGPTDMIVQRMVTTSDSALLMTYANGAGPHGHWTASLNESMNKGALLKYNIPSKSWTDITPDKKSKPAMSGITIDPNNPKMIVASTTNTWWAQSWATSKTVYGDEIFLSNDGGTTWTNLFGKKKTKLDKGEFEWANPETVADPLSLHWATCIVLDPFNRERVFVTSGNGIFMTDNLSSTVSTWKFQVKGLDETVPLDMVSEPYGAPLLSVIGDYDGFRHNDLNTSPVLGRHNPSIGSTNTIDFAEKDPRVVARAGSSAYYSTDNAKTWKALPSPVSGSKQGNIAVGADGKTIVWCPESKGVYTTSDNVTWTAATGISTNQRIISDRVNPSKFYAFYSHALYFSNNKGVTFTKGSAGSINSTGKIRCAPGHEGDIWIPAYETGLYRTVWQEGIPSYNKIIGVTRCDAIGFGKAAPGFGYPAIYIWGIVDGIEGIYRSDNEGDMWVRVNDDAHEFGGPGNANEVIGDPRIYGRVYMSTAGRGIVYGDLIDGPDSAVVIDSDYLPEVTSIGIGKKNDNAIFTIIPLNKGFKISIQEPGDYSITSLYGNIIEKGAYRQESVVGKNMGNGMYIVSFYSEGGNFNSIKYLNTID